MKFFKKETNNSFDSFHDFYDKLSHTYKFSIVLVPLANLITLFSYMNVLCINIRNESQETFVFNFSISTMLHTGNLTYI